MILRALSTFHFPSHTPGVSLLKVVRSPEAEQKLGASEATVKMHRSQLMKKIQAKSLLKLVRMAQADVDHVAQFASNRCFPVGLSMV